LGAAISVVTKERTTKRKLSELSVGNNVIIPIPQYDRGPTDPRNILGVIEEVFEYGFRVGTSVQFSNLLVWACHRTMTTWITQDILFFALAFWSFATIFALAIQITLTSSFWNFNMHENEPYQDSKFSPRNWWEPQNES
jgi:hypothetical protein